MLQYLIPHYGKLDTISRNRLLSGSSIVEEKYDGYSIYFGIFDGELQVETKKRKDVVDNPMAFTSVLPKLHGLPLLPEHSYYGEYLPRNQMVDIKYDRSAKGDIVLWDVQLPDGDWMVPKEKAVEATRLGLDCARLLAVGPTEQEHIVGITMWLNGDRKSRPAPEPLLGGTRMEGFIIKNYEFPQKGGLPTVAKVVL